MKTLFIACTIFLSFAGCQSTSDCPVETTSDSTAVVVVDSTATIDSTKIVTDTTK